MTEINHMDLVTRRDLEALTGSENGPCVSIQMPTHMAGPEVRQDPIRLKNLVGQAEDLLVEEGLRRPEAKELLEPARGLLDDRAFWRYQNRSLALYLAPGRFRTFRLPLEVPELAVAGRRFHLNPLLALLSGDGQFYVLALSQNQVRLLQATRYTISQVELEDVPESLAEALRYEDPERQLQWHTEAGPRVITASPFGGPATAQRQAMFHGHGATEKDVHKDEIQRFFHMLDRGLRDVLHQESIPLVLVGVDYLLPLYRDANTYPHLVERGATGNPDELSAKELHEACWELVEPLFRRAQEEAAAQYEELLGTGKSSSDLKEVVPAAHHGRVASLFVPVDVQAWGRFDPDTDAVEVHDEMRPGDEDVLDLTAVHTLLNGGSVFAVSPDELPGDGMLAGVFRY